MMFLIRSAFWLSVVFSAMPFDMAADRANGAKPACGLACAAMPAPSTIVAARAVIGMAKAGASANSLTLSDIAPPWRGHKGLD